MEIVFENVLDKYGYRFKDMFQTIMDIDFWDSIYPSPNIQICSWDHYFG